MVANARIVLAVTKVEVPGIGSLVGVLVRPAGTGTQQLIHVAHVGSTVEVSRESDGALDHGQIEEVAHHRTQHVGRELASSRPVHRKEYERLVGIVGHGVVRSDRGKVGKHLPVDRAGTVVRLGRQLVAVALADDPAQQGGR